MSKAAISVNSAQSKSLDNPMTRICTPGGDIARLLWKFPKEGRLYPPFPEPFIDDPSATETTPFRVTAPNSPGETLKGLFSPLETFPGIQVYLHGSQADGTATAFSDYDDLIIIDSSQYATFSKRRKLIAALNSVDRKFCTLDPLQHHGHWILSQRSLQQYNYAWMPPNVLRGAIRFHGLETLEFQLCQSESIAHSRSTLLQIHLNALQLSKSFFQRTINLYQLKCLVGSIALIPAIFHQANGEMLTKPEAIQKCKEKLSSNATYCLEWATEMRLQWAAVFTEATRQRLRQQLALIKNPILHRFTCSRIAPKFTHSGELPRLPTEHEWESFQSETSL